MHFASFFYTNKCNTEMSVNQLFAAVWVVKYSKSYICVLSQKDTPKVWNNTPQVLQTLQSAVTLNRQ